VFGVEKQNGKQLTVQLNTLFIIPWAETTFVKNVCDGCKSFFGHHYDVLPSVETVLKEAFNISRAISLKIHIIKL
jgi:hypothetical protein